MTAVKRGLPREIPSLIGNGALFVINHSGGKDSQAMTAMLRQIVPAEQIVVVHASLGDVEWPGTIDHIRDTIGRLPLHIVRARKTFFEMVEHRSLWPTPRYRQCTSDLKRTPIATFIRRLCRETGCSLVVNCLGLRAEESANRAKRQAFKRDTRLSKAGRTVYEWLPIQDWSLAWVWQCIRLAGQSPHWAYAAGMTRLSCSFCIMASRDDLRTAARLRPELYARYVATERRLGHMFACQKGISSLEDITGTRVAARLECAA